MHGGLLDRFSFIFFILHFSFFIFYENGQTRDGQTIFIKNPPGEPGGLQLKTTIVARFDMASIGTVHI